MEACKSFKVHEALDGWGDLFPVFMFYTNHWASFFPSLFQFMHHKT